MSGPTRTGTTPDEQRPATRLESLVTSLRGVPPDRNAPTGRRRNRAAGFSFAVVSGYVVGVAGFYTNFFGTLLQATAGLIDLFGTIFLVWLAVHSRRRPPPIAKRLALTLTSICLVLMGGITYAAVNPPQAPALTAGESCLYDVSAGTSIPLEPDGLIKQQIPVRADYVFAVSLIIGLDRSTAHPSLPHPVDVRITDADGSAVLIHQLDIRDNRLTRFNLPRALAPAGRTTLAIEVINKSTEQVGVYVKVPDDGDIVPAGLSGMTIRGHAGQEAPYRRPDWTLSGCIAGV
jgi:hypothetical protein